MYKRQYVSNAIRLIFPLVPDEVASIGVLPLGMVKSSCDLKKSVGKKGRRARSSYTLSCSGANPSPSRILRYGPQWLYWYAQFSRIAERKSPFVSSKR